MNIQGADVLVGVFLKTVFLGNHQLFDELLYMNGLSFHHEKYIDMQPWMKRSVPIERWKVSSLPCWNQCQNYVQSPWHATKKGYRWYRCTGGVLLDLDLTSWKMRKIKQVRDVEPWLEDNEPKKNIQWNDDFWANINLSDLPSSSAKARTHASPWLTTNP